jgi:hypothetical protein
MLIVDLREIATSAGRSLGSVLAVFVIKLWPEDEEVGRDCRRRL